MASSIPGSKPIQTNNETPHPQRISNDEVRLIHLPNEVWVYIESFFTEPGQTLNTTCTHLRSISNPELASWMRTTLSVQWLLKYKTTFTLDELRQCGKEFKSDNHFELDLSNSSITADELNSIVARFPNITAIKAINTKLSSKEFELLASLTELESLDLSCDLHSGITDTELTSIANLRNLKKLILTGNTVTNSGLKTLSCLKTTLTHLHLESTSITDDGLQYLAYLTNLTDLSLKGCSINGTGLVHLSDLPKLASLDLSWNHVLTVEGVGNLRSSSLRSLSLRFATGIHMLKHMSFPPNLTHLDISKTWIDDDSLDQLKALKHLTRLDLSNTSITDQGLEQLLAQNKDLNILIEKQRSEIILALNRELFNSLKARAIH